MISEQLRRAIAEAVDTGQTFYQIAKGAGVDWRIVSEYASGDRVSIRIETADRLCAYLGLELRPVRSRQTARKQGRKKPATNRKQGRKK